MKHSIYKSKKYLNVICRRKEFVIFRSHDSYVVYNTKRSFQNGHAHFVHLNTAFAAMKCVLKKEIPINHSKWFLESILRINRDKEYSLKIKDLMINYEALMRDTNDIDYRKC